MKLAVDAMGGDYAPAEIVKGAVDGARQYGVDLVLVGPEDRIREELAKTDTNGINIDIVHTDEYIVEGEHPAYALRQKRKASVLLATKLVKKGEADAMFSAGSTGGVMASALYVLGTIEGLSRPVAGGPMLGFAPNTVIMDVGTNVDCTAEQLLDIAIVGTVYCRTMLNIENPTVGLLSVGAEEGKGNEKVKEAYQLIKKSGLNFVGNVEGYGIPLGAVNVVVCDGFVGNILMKYTEALGGVLSGWLREKLAGKASEADIQSLIGGLKANTNMADAMGGGPLWAVDGICCAAHGRSKAPEIALSVRQAKEAVEKDLAGMLKKELAVIKSKMTI